MQPVSHSLLGLQPSWFADLSESQVTGLLLWGGLALLTISLLILMRTRWGQAEPLSKCVALSVFAHLLLFGYAYATKLIFDYPPVRPERIIELTINDARRPLPNPTEQPDDPQPWSRLAADEQPQPEPVELDRRTAAAIDAPERMVDSIDPGLPSQPPRLPTETVEPLQPEIESPKQVMPPIAQSAAAPMAIEPPATQTSDEPRPPTPGRGSQPTIKPVTLPREVADTESPTRAIAPELLSPNEILAVATQVKQLAEKPLPAETPEARVAANDQLSVSNPPSQAASAGAPGDNANSDPSSSVPSSIPRRLGDGEPVPAPYRRRVRFHDDTQRLRAAGGDPRTEQAVDAALRWLAENQEDDGRWTSRRHGGGQVTGKFLGHDREGAGAKAETGVTGLALLAFLAHGESHLEGNYRDHVRRGLEYLLSEQRSDGDMAGSAKFFARMYCHGMATLAITEAYAMTGDVRLRPYVEKAIRFTVDSQNPLDGGWRYLADDRGDMSQFGWQLMALKSAELAGLTIPESTRSGMKRFLRRFSVGRHGGLSSYRFRDEPSPTMTAEALVCRFFLNDSNRPQAVREATDFILEELPGTSRPNLYYWYYASIALNQVQGEAWQRWNTALKRELLKLQRSRGPEAGSWDSSTVWGGYGGRVYSTAMGALCLEVYYRYLPLLE